MFKIFHFNFDDVKQITEIQVIIVDFMFKMSKKKTDLRQIIKLLQQILANKYSYNLRYD